MFFSGLAGLACGGLVQAQPAPVLDVRPAFMQIITNRTLQTNVVIVTNLVVTTNWAVTTNYYNAQGQLLQPVQPQPPPIPGLIPIPQSPAVTAPAPPPAPDPAVVKSNQVLALRELLGQSLIAISNKICAPGSFAGHATQQIQLPQGVTSFDRKKGDALVAAMNQAAENAAPESLAIVQKAALQFKPDDPAAVINGEKDAATRQFWNAQGNEITQQVLAVVKRTAAEAKVQSAYNAVMLKGGGLLGAVLGGAPAVDVDSHITTGLLQALVNNLAEQESRIRTDPAARPTKILQDTFKKK